MTAELRIGLIGAGYIAGWHAAALRAVPGMRLAAICDAAPAAASAMARACNVPAFDSVGAMIAAGAVDAVHVLTPPPTHASIAIECLTAGLHVLAESEEVGVHLATSEDGLRELLAYYLSSGDAAPG